MLDFAPNRALSLYADYGMRLGDGEDADEDVRDLNRFLPVLGFDGTRMEPIDVDRIIDVAFAMNAQDVRKLRMESRSVLNPDHGLLGFLSEGAQEALRGVSRFSARSATSEEDELDVNRTDPIEPTSSSVANGDDEIERELGDDELQERLRFLATRVNAFMYLSEDLEKNLRHVLATREIDLFRTVLEVMPEDMKALVDVGLFSEQAMRLVIHQFRRADEAAYRYLGFDARAQSTTGHRGEE